MAKEKQGCDRAQCQNHDGQGKCTLENPKVWKREALIDCLDYKNPE